MTDTNHTEAMRLADGIKVILEDEAFKAAVSLTQARIFEAWSAADDYNVREALHAEMKALDRLLDGFEHIFNEGLVAKHIIANSGISQ